MLWHEVKDVFNNPLPTLYDAPIFLKSKLYKFIILKIYFKLNRLTNFTNEKT